MMTPVCSICGKYLEYLGGIESMFKSTASVIGNSSALEQWRGSVCQGCGYIFCLKCVDVWPPQCPICKKPTKPTMRCYLNGVPRKKMEPKNKKIIEATAETLEQAEKELYKQIPKEFKVFGDVKMISDGKEQVAEGFAWTEEQALEKARKMIPNDSIIQRESITRKSGKRNIKLSAWSSFEAREKVAVEVKKEFNIINIIEISKPRKGYWGIRKKVGLFEIEIEEAAIANVSYYIPPKMQAIIGTLTEETNTSENSCQDNGKSAAIEINNEKEITDHAEVPDSYVNDCLIQKYVEKPEERKWDSDTKFKDILEPLNNGNYNKACEEADKLSKEFGDFDLIYSWWAKALMRMKSFDQARQVLLQGLGKSKGKWNLCNRLGEVEWESGNGKEAVYWWAQAMHCQESLDDFGQDSGSYLYLHYFADGLGLSDCASAFIGRSDQIRPGMVRLDHSYSQGLRALARNNKGLGIEEVIKGLYEKYFAPSKSKGGDSSQDAEVDRLIRLLDINQNDDHKSREEAAKRLGDIGDPRAIGPLMAATRDILIGVQWAAEEALKKIKGK